MSSLTRICGGRRRGKSPRICRPACENLATTYRSPFKPAKRRSMRRRQRAQPDSDGCPAEGDMDGIEASARIMGDFWTPVIFLTAYADDNSGRAKLTEPFGFILKPFNERELHTAIQVALHRQVPGRTAKKRTMAGRNAAQHRRRHHRRGH